MSARSKSAASPERGRRARPGSRLRWVSGVSPDGELFLRRHEVADTQGDIEYPFAQGLAFVARRWRNLMNRELQAEGQSHARWGTLFWIAVLADRVNQTQLAARMGVEQPTLGRVLRELEADGLIQRRASKLDGRARVIELTAAAAPLMRKINRIQNSVRRHLLNGIDPEELAICLATFAKILGNMEEHGEEVA